MGAFTGGATQVVLLVAGDNAGAFRWQSVGAGDRHPGVYVKLGNYEPVRPSPSPPARS